MSNDRPDNPVQPDPWPTSGGQSPWASPSPPPWNPAQQGSAPQGQPPQGQHPQPGQYPPAGAPWGAQPSQPAGPGYPPAGPPQPGAGPFQGGFPGQQGPQGAPGGQPGYPYAQQPPSGPQGFASVPPGQPPQGGKPGGSSKLPLFIGIGAGALVIALVAFFALRGMGGAPEPGPDGGPTAATPSVAAETASAAVRGYLEALAAGNAEQAIAFGDSAPTDTTFLTSEVLTAALAKSPITAIEVAEDSGTSSYQRILASYQLGTRKVSNEFSVMKKGNLWRLSEVVATARLGSMRLGDNITLNGIAVTTDEIDLFPGSYTLATADPRFAITKGAFTVDFPGRSPNIYEMRLGLSKAGTKSIVDAAQSKLNACLKKKELQPSGCGFGVNSNQKGVKPKASTIKWTVRGGKNSIRDMTARVSSSSPTEVTASVSVQTQVTFSSTDGRRWRGYSGIYRVTADLTDPAKVAVSFG